MDFDKNGLNGGDAYEDLANAIIYYSIVDYTKTYKKLNKIWRERKVLMEKAVSIPCVFLNNYDFKEFTRRLRYHSTDIEQTLKDIEEVKRIRSRLQYIKDKEREYKRLIRDCERFFEGEWFEALSNVSGKDVKSRLDSDLISKGLTLLEREEN